MTSSSCSSTPISCMTIHDHLKQKLAYLCLHGFQDVLAKMAFLRGGVKYEMGGAMLTHSELVLTFVDCCLYATFDENRSRKCDREVKWVGFNVPVNTIIGHFGDGFCGSNDPTNSVKALKVVVFLRIGFNPTRPTSPCYKAKHAYNTK